MAGNKKCTPEAAVINGRTLSAYIFYERICSRKAETLRRICMTVDPDRITDISVRRLHRSQDAGKFYGPLPTA